MIKVTTIAVNRLVPRNSFSFVVWETHVYQKALDLLAVLLTLDTNSMMWVEAHKSIAWGVTWLWLVYGGVSYINNI